MGKPKKDMKRKRIGHSGVSESFQNNDEDGEGGDFGEDMVQSKKWYEDADLQEMLSKNIEAEVKCEELERLRKEAKHTMDGMVAVNSNKPPKSISQSDFTWMKTVMAKGTKGDKVAAYVVLIQDSPVYNLNLLNNVINMVKVGKKEWILAGETLQELFLNDLLPRDRKLVFFHQQPLQELKKFSSGFEGKRKNLLTLWYFENQLKLAYRDFIVAVNQIAHDSVDANKEKAITIMFKLLESSPEQESALLSNIVNKLGDPSHKVGSKVIYTLTKLLQVHPNMREVVMDEVEKLVFRSNISKRAQYYSICFLAQFCLSSQDAKLAKKLISVYLSIFKACIKLGEIDSRMMSALLTGVNRAYPFAKDETVILQDQINTIYKVVHFGKPNVSIQALSLLYLMSDTKGSLTDRFFMALYKQILELKLYNCTHHAMFLNLIFRSLKKDKSPERLTAFLKRLLQVSSYLSSSIVCGILVIISEVLAHNKEILLLEHKPHQNGLSKPSYHSDDDDEDDNETGYEHYEDVPLDSEGGSSEGVKMIKTNATPSKGAKASKSEPEADSNRQKVWRNPDISPEDRRKEVTEYNAYHRNPLFAGGEKSVLVELNKLVGHYHPSVSLFASTILKGERIRYDGDPLKDFALIRFLDKFSFKNPKALKPAKEEKETFNKFGKRKLYNHIIMRKLIVDKEVYLKRNEKTIPADEKFIYSYLKKRTERESRKGVGEGGEGEGEGEGEGDEDDESDVESVASAEFEEMIHKMTGSKDVEDIDFLNEAGQLPRKEKGKHKTEGTGSEDEMSDGESSVEEFDGNELDDISDDLLEGSELDESEVPPALRNLGDFRKQGGKKGLKRRDNFSKEKLFASAEEFSELLEQTDYRAGGSEAVMNRDNAGLKQLKWESDRNNKFKGPNKRKRFTKSKSIGTSKDRGGKKKRF